MKRLELIAPARDFASAKAAIDCGADAVYIGARRFGARQAAANSTTDVAEVCRYAHLFGVKIYATLNTLIFDDELTEAETVARELINAGVDALIVQDMAFLRMGLDVELHASTQTVNDTPEKVRFLQECGFAKVVLERGLTLEQIKNIREQTSVELEAFVHGAICVGHSGDCYLSRSMGPRSGNRGACAQPCRLTYDLENEKGTKILKNAHLLSLRDLNVSARIPEFIDAGVTSFKIEGRLKETDYIINTVAHYRHILDREIARRGLQRASAGRSTVSFTPDPERSFTRGFTEYYAAGKTRGAASFDTPKATGRYIGRVARIAHDHFEIAARETLTAGDGICFAGGAGQLSGTNVNRVEGSQVWPNNMAGLTVGTDIYRNFDKRFADTLAAAKIRREIPVEIDVRLTSKGIFAEASDTRGTKAAAELRGDFPAAQKPEQAIDTIKTQLAKTGDTCFAVQNIRVEGRDIPFLPASQLNALRRQLLENLTTALLADYRRPVADVENREYPYLPDPPRDVTNRLAAEFYKDHGVADIPAPAELSADFAGQRVMTTPYCIRREIGQCLKEKPTLRSELYLTREGYRYRLCFDCEKCMMNLYMI